MKISELVAALQRLPQDMDIYLESDDEAYPHLSVEAVVESCTDDTVIGYVLTGSDAHQLELPFDEEKIQ